MDRLIVGLDIGTDNVRVVIAEIDFENKIQVLGLAEKASAGMRNGVIVNVDAAASVIKEAIEEAEVNCGVSIPSVYTVIGGSQFESYNSRGGGGIDLEGRNRPLPVNEAAIERAIKSAQAVKISLDKRLIHTIPQEYIIDNNEVYKKDELIGSYGVRLEVTCHLVTASMTAYDKILKTIDRAGYTVENNGNAVILKTLAASQSCIHEDEMELGSILIDLGAGTTDVMVLYKGAPVYSASIPLGQKNVTNDIAKIKGIPFETAEEIKIKDGSAWPQDDEEKTLIIPPVGGKPPEEIRQKQLCAIIMAREEEILTMVKRSVVQNANVKKLDGSIVLTGGGAELPGIIELTQAVWKTSSVRLGVCGDFGGDDDSYRSPSFATAMGIIFASRIFSAKAKSEKKSRGLKEKDSGKKKTNGFKKFLSKIF